MRIADAARRIEIERQVALCVKIAGLGFGPEVMRLALERNGVPPAAARLIALSVASSRAALTSIEAGALPVPALTAQDRERRRAARAASRFLGRLLAFFWIGLVAVGGGLALGWIVGFERGAADGLDSVARALQTLFWR